ncbi:MAG: AsmA family protein [Pseudomonadota bacterium]
MRFRRWMVWVGVPVVALGLLAVLFSWSLFIPMVERRATAALGQPVTIGGLGASLGRVIKVRLRDVVVANPPGFDAEPPFARLREVIIRFDVGAWWRGEGIVLPMVELRGGDIQARVRADGTSNLARVAEEPAPVATNATPEERRFRLAEVRVADTTARFVHEGLGGDATATFETRELPTAGVVLTAEAQGTYAGQPLTASLIGGSVVALGDTERPWPVALTIQNGPTEATIEGRLRNPLAMTNADVQLTLEGPDMGLLTPLTGVPIPQTPRYRVTGRLDYTEARYHFTGIEGVVGRSDIGGDVTINPHGAVPDVTANLRSNRVDLRDLAGFIGGQPGREGPLREDRPSSGRVLPNAPVNIPKFEAANVHLQYEAAQILGDRTPLDNLRVSLELIGGVATLRPLRFGIGQGALAGNLVLTPQQGGTVEAVADLEIQQVDIGRLMRAAGTRGGGALNGRARITSTGRSLAELMARGDGTLFLSTAGGNLSAFIVDLSGLRLGNALLSGLGLPDRTELRCFVADMVMRRGVLQTRAAMLETEDALISGTGTVRLSDERLDMRLRSESKRFTIGALPTALLLTGTFANPSVTPEVVELGVRGGLAVGLGFAALPLAILPTIELGIGEDPRCADMRARVRRR